MVDGLWLSLHQVINLVFVRGSKFHQQSKSNNLGIDVRLDVRLIVGHTFGVICLMPSWLFLCGVWNLHALVSFNYSFCYLNSILRTRRKTRNSFFSHEWWANQIKYLFSTAYQIKSQESQFNQMNNLLTQKCWELLFVCKESTLRQLLICTFII